MSDPTRQSPRGQALGAVRRLSIAVSRGPDAGKMFEPESGASATVGTAADVDCILTDPMVSRYHLELLPNAEGILVRDLGSTNGTFAGGVRLREGIVGPGTSVRVGDSTLVLDAARADASPEADVELPKMVFVSAKLAAIARKVHLLAAGTTTVLVEGETGTGKELIARALHDLGPRAQAPFVTVDAAALPGTLLEAELFGHERGAFTGAARARPGAFERAHGGTIFLDEIGELPQAAQASLLGVLERRRFRRVGGDKEIAVDVRVVSATNRDLRAEVNKATFRPDLYFRLAGARVVLPPLRERPEDVPVLLRHFALELTGTDLDISSQDLNALAAQHWPGNVRELRSVVERTIALGALGGGVAAMLEESAVPTTSPSGEAPVERYRDAKAHAVEAFERSYLAMLIARANGNASEAARLAKMDRPYLLGLLRRYGLR